MIQGPRTAKVRSAGTPMAHIVAATWRWMYEFIAACMARLASMALGGRSRGIAFDFIEPDDL